MAAWVVPAIMIGSSAISMYMQKKGQDQQSKMYQSAANSTEVLARLNAGYTLAEFYESFRRSDAAIQELELTTLQQLEQLEKQTAYEIKASQLELKGTLIAAETTKRNRTAREVAPSLQKLKDSVSTVRAATAASGFRGRSMDIGVAGVYRQGMDIIDALRGEISSEYRNTVSTAQEKTVLFQQRKRQYLQDAGVIAKSYIARARDEAERERDWMEESAQIRYDIEINAGASRADQLSQQATIANTMGKANVFTNLASIAGQAYTMKDAFA